MVPASPPAVRGEPAAAEGPAAGRSLAPGDLARRVRHLRILGGSFHVTTILVTFGVLALIAVFVGVLVHGAWESIVRFGPSFLFGTTWDAVSNVYGAGFAIDGTLLTSALALLIAVPIALGVAVFLSEVAPPWLRRPLVYVVDLSAAVPSVVYGFWAFMVLVPLMKGTVEPGLSSLTGGGFPFSSQTSGKDILTATLVLAAMILPTIAAVSRESMRAVPRVHRESAMSLGATRWETTRIGVFPSAWGGILAGIVLGLGRALGETIAVTMVIGNIPILPGTLFSPGATLATQIVNTFPGEPGINTSAILELALILFAITLVVNVFARGLFWRIRSRGEDEPTPIGRRFRHRVSATVRARAEGSGASGSTVSPLPPTEGGLPSREAGWRRRVLEAAPRRIRRRRALQWGIVALTAGCVLLAIVPLAGIVYTAIQYGGAAVVQPSFYTSVPPQGCNPAPGVTCSLGGIGPEIQGTLIMLGLGALIAVPVGLFAGIYLAEYGARNRFARLVSFLSDVMTGVPTIILGVFVFTLFLFVDHDAAASALSGGVALGVLMIPIAIRGTEEALRAVPSTVRESALALGFPPHRVTLRVVLGCARGGLVTGMLLAASRAAGDTAVLVFTAGGSSFWFQSLNTPTAAMTPFIFSYYGSPFLNLRTDAWGAALVLLVVMLVISLGTRLAFPEGAGSSEAV
jgi:phosphate ABC transporter permease protein PstC/phosphate ABC transporter permease subunit PstA